MTFESELPKLQKLNYVEISNVNRVKFTKESNETGPNVLK